MKQYIVPDKARSPIWIAHVIGISLSEWAGNCYGIASLVLKKKLVRGKIRYGTWLGEINEDSPFGGRAFTHHAWILLPDGRVYDPTRFVFEGQEPYVFVSNTPEGTLDEYDFGSNAIREAMRKPFPKEVTADDKFCKLVLSRQAVKHMEHLAGTTLIPPLTRRQAAWFANLRPQDLHPHTKEIYRALVRAREGCLIPIDNQRDVLGKPA